MRCLAIALQLWFVHCSVGTPNGGYITLKNLGCWRDGRFHLIPALEGKSRYLTGDYSRRGEAIQKCARAAWERGYRAFVLQNGGWCGSSSNAIIKYSRLGKADDCGSKGKGGFQANQVYEIKSFTQPHRSRGPTNLQPSYVFEDGSEVGAQDKTAGSYEFILSDLGCWKLPPSGVRSMEGRVSGLDGHYRSRTNAITKCAKGLANLGYQTMAMYDGGECMVVTDIEAVALATRRRPLCSHTGEGTTSSIQIYEIRYSDTRYPPPPLPTSPTTTTIATTTASTTPPTTPITLPWVVDPIIITRTFPRQQPSRFVSQRRIVPTIIQFVTRPNVVPTNPRPVTQPRVMPTIRGPVTQRRPAAREPSEYFHVTDLGCWSYAWNDSLPSLEGASDELDGHYSQRVDAIRKCAKAASQLGYEVFALQDGGRCTSSQDARERFARHGQSTYCRQDGRGGSWVNQVYEVNVVWEVRISGLGCFTAGDPNVLESLEGSSSILDGESYQRSDAVRKCARVAASRGFEVFALHDDGECLSSANARIAHMTNASNECPLSGRGGFGANQVYEIIGADKIRLRNLGCWKDTAFRAVPGLENTDSELMDNFRIRKDALNKCAMVAWRTGLNVFVLQNGGWCGGSVLAETTYMKYGASTRCKPDGEGGHKANQVYEILDG